MSIKNKRKEAAIHIQRKFRIYLENRYRDMVKNFDDDDPITSIPVANIPRKLLYITNDKFAFHAAGLLLWLSKKRIHPYTREKVPKRVLHELYQMITIFLKTDYVVRNSRKGYYTKKNLCRKAVYRYEKFYFKKYKV